MRNILEVSGLCKSYRGFALDHVGFTLPENCIAGFIGINGAGKTTTVRTLLGLAAKEAGTVKVFGKDMDAHGRDIKNEIGVVLDSGSFFDELSMDEMKGIVAPAYSCWDENQYRAYMERFQLNPRQKIKTLSKGMSMKFALALALSHKAKLLIMDEPTTGLDPLIREEFLQILLDFMKPGGKGVLFSTHITSDLDKAADVIILIHNGKILFEKNKDSLLDTYRLVKGEPELLTDDIRRLFLSLETTNYGFRGITGRLPELQSRMRNILVERPTIEDIMLGFTNGGKSRCN